MRLDGHDVRTLGQQDLRRHVGVVLQDNFLFSGSVLDNSMIVCGSGIGDGNAHNHNELPIILAGGGAGALQPGRHVRYDKDTPMTNLYMSMFDKMGVKADRMGDSTGVLKDI